MFSVLLSIYYKERPDFLRQSLDSLFSQTLLPTEVVLVKDGPLTKTLDIIIEEYSKRYLQLKIVSLSVNQGLGKALNEGLKYCSYDLVARMDTDDIAKPNRFEKQLKVFNNHPDIDIVSSWIDEFEGDTNHILSIRKLPEYHKEIYKFAKKRNPINHPAVMFRKSSVLAAGGYKHFPLFEDYYLWVRMLMNGAKFYNIQESLLYFRSSSDMFKRRGGINYALMELKFEQELLRIKFIDKSIFIKNILIRFISRLIPNKLRTIIYKHLLR
ncbi:glycosyltransferase family 2 protein [Parabacteroides goldsteinii]|jgi:glycoside transferase family 2|uniref:glycosyltransferase family 2 protein n=1 Tax=Parabacteroides goldsteinii TaxID=328812 RepID=UPI002673B464|nr:glycosyltransferase [Parabacteroides goldsteinii]